MSASDVRAILCAAAVLGAVLATLAMTACASAPRPVARLPEASDGLWRDLAECQAVADAAPAQVSQDSYDRCLASKGL